jgi:hypothetical protein
MSISREGGISAKWWSTCAHSATFAFRSGNGSLFVPCSAVVVSEAISQGVMYEINVSVVGRGVCDCR